MKWLAMNSSTERLALALFEDGQCVAEALRDLPLRQSEAMLPECDALLAQAGWDKNALEAMALSLGPGSFTGLRAGLALGLGMRQGRGLRLWGVPEWSARAARLKDAALGQELAVWLDGRKGLVYWALLARQGDAWAELKPSELISVQEALRRLSPGQGVVGDASLYLETAPLIQSHGGLLADESLWSADAVSVGHVAWPSLSAGKDALDLEPLYLRPSEAEIKWKQLHPSQGA
jgi:tRNA threonylcarbamoyladenosine biosynthesis protein TsaB